MNKQYASVSINEVEVEPLSEYVIEFLTAQKKECPYLDFKYTIHIGKDSDFPELGKDIFAFSNYGGGWILVGWKEVKPNVFVPTGVPHEYAVDGATLQEKFNSFVDSPIELKYKEFELLFNGVNCRFAAIFVPPSNVVLVPNKEGKYKKGEKDRIVFKKEQLFYRRGSQSTIPSEYEKKLIEQRVKNENYRLSLLSGEPDEIEEVIYSNLLPISKSPEFIYLGANRPDNDDVTIKQYLRDKGVFPEFFYKFKQWDNSFVTFENLTDAKNIYSGLVIAGTIKKEKVSDWLQDGTKSKIIIELLNKELRHYAVGKHMFLFKEKNKLFYPTNEDTRKISWKSKYSESTRTVAAKMFASQVGGDVYFHAAFEPSFIQIDRKIYLEINPSFVITSDGHSPLTSMNVGTIITRLSYNKYNDSQRNNILFWVSQLKNGNTIKIAEYLEISPNLISTKLSHGIIFDRPSTDFKFEIKDVKCCDAGDTLDI